MQEPPFGRRGDYLFFSRSRGAATFPRFSLEYDDFLVFFERYKKAKPVAHMTDQYLLEGLALFQDFQAKKLAAMREKIAKDRKNLPIFAFRDQIISAVTSHRVVLIAADTGAGKSTQVPQYLMEAGLDKIACTQPRRIACFSLAKRVGFESLNRYGSQIAFKVRFDDTASDQTKILFLTEGVLIRQYSGDPFLRQYNIVIIDEVHERHISGDFILGIMKKILSSRSDIRIVLMSATINTSLFSRYFDSAPIIQVPGRMFPVSITYIPVENKDPNLCDSRLIQERRELTQPVSIASRPIKIKPGPYIKILEQIDEKYHESERGDLLVFVSGMFEISVLSQELTEYARSNNRWIVLELHSSLSVADQEKVFDVAPPGVRKCILSTNIAETSVTIDGIRFVADSGKVKEMGYDAKQGISRLSEFWISQSSAKQRAGRAGRTGPGECFRLYSKEEYDQFLEFPIPEIFRMPLDTIVLECKALGLGDAKLFEFIEKPDDDAIAHASSRLVDLGCMAFDEQITPLGTILSTLPLDLKLGKMLVLGSISSLLKPVLVIAAALSVQSPFSRLGDENQMVISNRKSLFSTHGDAFTLLNCFTKWLELKGLRDHSSRLWCRSHGIDETRLYELVKLRQQFERTLEKIQLLPPKELEEPAEGPDPQARFERLLLRKRKDASRTSTRKFLKLDTNINMEDEEDEQVLAEPETIHELEFRLNNNAKAMLADSDVPNLSHRELTIIKLIVASGLYPNIAVCDPANHSRPNNEQFFHTKSKLFLHMVPSSVFAWNPELLHGTAQKPSATQETLASLHELRLHQDVLIYVQVLETTKPFILNPIMVPALPVTLLFAKKIDIAHDLAHVVVDEWIDIAFDDPQEAAKLLTLGNWLRYAWQARISQRIGNQTSPLQYPKRNLSSVPFVQDFMVDMRNDWLRFESHDAAPLADEDILDRLVEFVDIEARYSCKKAKLSSISDLFGYDPFGSAFGFPITPNFVYWPKSQTEAERYQKNCQLPRGREAQPEIATGGEDRPDRQDKSLERQPFECPSCSHCFLFTSDEAGTHLQQCQ
ncbi:DEAH (Asp-Glu-Ala-His) box polypeptide 34 [Kappamyces sp. JEL0680]|nr:DEAH (Asp-Glu-Ala-His) box polypeptide 34 [Kappamyces sp. JEL0680]